MPEINMLDVVNELEKQGYSQKQIGYVASCMFLDDKISIDAYVKMLKADGIEMNIDLTKLSKEDQKTAVKYFKDTQFKS